MNFTYPVFLNLRGKRCVVVGQGFEIPTKVQGLVDAGADVVYLNDTADPRISALAESGAIHWEKRGFQRHDLHGCLLVISDHASNAEIFRDCEQAGVLCNSVDDPEHCRFSFGSIHRQGDLTIAISTSGSAPALAVRLKQQLQREFGPEYATFLGMLKAVRPDITGGIADFEQRRALWYRIVDSEILDLLRADREDQAEATLERLIQEAMTEVQNAHRRA